MIIFVMRHGEAEPYKQDDQSRHLTKFGITQSEHASKWIAKQLNQQLGLKKIDLTFVSPYLRTLETMEAVKQFVTLKEIILTQLVTPAGDANAVQDLIDGSVVSSGKQDQYIQSLLIISHMPLVSLLSDVVCQGFNASIFDTADVLMVDYDTDKSKGRQLAYYQSLA